MEKSLPLPLNDWQVQKRNRAINRLHGFIHGGALAALFYYRITTIAAIAKSSSSILPHLLIFAAELTLSCMWLLSQASLWNPVTRNAYPERLPGDDNLPAIDVFVCTADPAKEPSLGVMNTVISAMALDYPPHKLHLYLSDDGGSPVTLRALRRARSFAKLWIPFCRKFGVKNRCPQAYFLREENGGNGDHFFVEKKAIEKAYDDFKISLGKIIAEAVDVGASRDHAPIIEVSSPFFAVFVFVFLSSQLKHAEEVFASGDSIKTWWTEQRVWMMKSLTSFFFAAVNASLEKVGLTKASFVPTNKVTDDEVEKLYQMGEYDFQAPPLFMLILCTLYLLNIASFVVGFVKILQNGKMMNAMVMQAFLPLFGAVLHLPLMEGMVLRKDKGRVSPSVSLLSAVISSLVLAYAALVH